MKPTFLGIILIGGGSSWQYASSPEEAVRGVAKRLRSDWGNLFKIEKGRVVKVNVYDVTDIPDGTSVYWDERGVFAKLADGERQIDRLDLVEATIT